MRTNSNRMDRRPGLALVFAWSVAACGADGGSEPWATGGPESVAQSEAALATYNMSDWEPWPSNLSICFTRTGTLSSSLYAQAKPDIMAALNATWGAASALDFSGGGDCATSPGDLEIELNEKATAGQCGSGVGASCWVGVDGNRDTYRGVAVHEVGHGLGLAHEHQRADPTGTTWEQPLCPVEVERERVGAPGQRTPIPDLQKLTLFDPQSVMNYCAVANGRVAGSWGLTNLDALGIEILYPFSTSHQLLPGGSLIKKGSTLVASGRDQIMIDWARRGAVQGAYSFGPIWDVDGHFHTAGGGGFALSSLTPGSHTIIAWFSDLGGRRHTTNEIRVTVSTGVHTAVVSTVTTS